MSDPARRARLERLFRPRRVAIIGATNGPHPTYNAVENLKLLGFEGAIDLVNPKYDRLHDLPCYPSVTDLPQVPDAVLIGVPKRYVPGIVEECGEKGVLGATIFTAGFSESGPDGAALENELVATAGRYGMMITGPNGLGWVNLNDRAALYGGSLQREHGPGSVAVISQSGSGLIAILHAGRGLPVGFVVSSGNESMVDAADYIDWLADRPEIEVILFFMETVRRGPAFLATVERARSAGKILVVLKTGRSEIGKRATLAHTGAIAGSSLAYDAVFRRLGIHSARSVDELLEMGLLFARHRAAPTAPGLGLITVSGGLLALYADLAEPLRLEFPAFSPETAAGLTDTFASVNPTNPLDAAGSVYSPEAVYTRYIELVANDPGIGLLAIAQEAPPGMGATQAARYGRILRAVCEAGARAETPVVLFTTAHSGIEAGLWADLREQPLPVLFGAAESLRAIAAYFEHHRARPEPTSRLSAVDPAAVRADLEQAVGPALTERAGKALLRRYGIAAGDPRLATSAAEAAEAADDLGYPLVAKVESADVTHKARVGGVRLGIRSAAEAAAAHDEIVSAVRAGAPNARIGGIILERQVPDGLEILAGVWRDPTFGPLLLLGPGGAYAEALGGQVAAPAPLSVAEAERLIADSAVGRALTRSGYTPAALTRLADLLARLSELADDLREDLDELDLNPIRFTAIDGQPLALDALVVLRRGASV